MVNYGSACLPVFIGLSALGVYYFIIICAHVMIATLRVWLTRKMRACCSRNIHVPTLMHTSNYICIIQRVSRKFSTTHRDTRRIMNGERKLSAFARNDANLIDATLQLTKSRHQSRDRDQTGSWTFFFRLVLPSGMSVSIEIFPRLISRGD